MPRGIYQRTAQGLKNLSEAHKGKKASEETKRRMSETHKKIGSGNNLPHLVGPKNFQWKGNKVGYHALHLWVNTHLGKPVICQHCGKKGLKGREIHWANKDHTYKRNLVDWISLCMQCHGKYDKAHGLRRHERESYGK